MTTKTLCPHCNEPLEIIEVEGWCLWRWDEKDETYKTYDTTDQVDYVSGRMRCAQCLKLLSEEFIRKHGIDVDIFGVEWRS